MTVKAAAPHLTYTQKMRRQTLEVRYLDTPGDNGDIHAHPFYEIYFFLEGNLERYVVGGRSYRLHPGDVLILPPGVPHHPILPPSDKPYRRYVLWLSEEVLQQLEQLDPSLLNVLQYCTGEGQYRIRSASPAVRKKLEEYLQVMWEEELADSTCKHGQLYGLCLSYLSLLNRMLMEGDLLTSKRQQSDSLLNQVLAYISDNYAKTITLNSVADHFFTSPSNIENLLTKSIKKPFYRYVTECRIIHAQALIAGGMPLQEVSQACGYNDYSNFYRAFTREVGISPSRYRQHIPTNHFQSTNIQEIT